MSSTGEVEAISDAYCRVSKKYQLVLCDSISAYRQLSTEQKMRYYQDTIHQNNHSQRYLEQLIADELSKQLSELR